MHFLELIPFSCALATAIQPPIVPFVQQIPIPLLTGQMLGVYRFVNIVNGTAFRLNDSSADSLIMAMYIAVF